MLIRNLVKIKVTRDKKKEKKRNKKKKRKGYVEKRNETFDSKMFSRSRFRSGFLLTFKWYKIVLFRSL